MSKKELFEIFQQCFGRLLTPFEIEDINKWIDEDDMPVEVVKAALKEAVTNNKISWKYVNKILIDWHKAGDNTLEKVEKRLSDFEAKKASRYQRNQPFKSNVPEWTEKDYKHEATPEEQAQLEALRKSMSED